MVLRFLLATENILAVISLVLIVVFPSLEVIARKFFNTGIHSNAEYVQHLVLWITFVGGMITSREERHLSFSVGLHAAGEKYRRWIKTGTSCIAVAVGICLAYASLTFVREAFIPSMKTGIFPQRAVMAIMPFGFAVMTVRFIWCASGGIYAKIIAFCGIPLAALLGFVFDSYITVLVWPIGLVLMAGALLGMPIFIALGGFAALLFMNSGGMTAVIPNEAYTMLTSPVVPTIPLFTLAGFILSESKAGGRLITLFREVFGWLPGGLAVVAILICTFFTALTGASGVTILALGGLLFYVLTESKYSESFSTGLLTVNGIGSLFPPSLPIIMYSVMAQISIRKMFVGVIIPGTVMVLFLVALSVVTAMRRKIARTPFNFRAAAVSVRETFWEIMLPVVILGLFFGGITTIVETGAFSVLYVLFIEAVIHRDFNLQGLVGAFLKSVPIMGGVLIILAVAKGLSYFIVDAEIPMMLAQWLHSYVQSKYVFLVLLNIALLLTGCFMDVFSAIVVVVPLIIPLAESYGIHPVHLGVIFLANLEVGYCTPPVGINLFLASYRFNVPLARVYRDVLPFVIVMLLSVLCITYIPWLTTGLLDIIKY